VITPPAPPPPAIIFTPAPAPAGGFAPAPSSGFAPSPAVPVSEGNENKSEVKKIDSATVVVVIAPALKEEIKAVPAELKSQEIKRSEPLKIEDRAIVKIAPSKVPAFKGAGPFKFSLGVKEENSATTVSDPSVAAGVRVISQTPAVCKVVSTFNKETGRYAVSVQGIANGTCRITAIDSGSEENYPTATEIRQQITGIVPQKNIKSSAKKLPAKKSGIKKASFTRKPTP
jgi:hypothetical protein